MSQQKSETVQYSPVRSITLDPTNNYSIGTESAVYWGLYKDKETGSNVLLFKTAEKFIVADFELISRNGKADIYLVAKQIFYNLDHLEYIRES